MRVHITLDKETRSSETAKRTTFDALVRLANLRDVNATRFDRYGIISADVPNLQSVEKIKQTAGVQSVEADEVRYAM